MKRIVIIVASAVMALMSGSGCKRLPLYDESGELLLELSIDLDLVNVDEVSEPETMQVLFYDAATRGATGNDFVGPRGGALHVEPGHYSLLVYNFGTESTILRNTDDHTQSEAYTNEVTSDIRAVYNRLLRQLSASSPTPPVGASSAESGMAEPVVFEPDHLFVGRVGEVAVPVRVEGSPTMVVRAEARSVVKTYTLEIGPITGGEYIRSSDIFVTGQVRSNFIWSDSYGPDRATLYVPVTLDGDRRSFQTTFNTFGKYPGAENRVHLQISVTDSGGKDHSFSYDVTDQFDDPSNTSQKIVIDTPITIPRPETGGSGGGGFLPEVEEWPDEVTDIEL